MKRYTTQTGGHFNFPIYTEPVDASGVTPPICNNFIQSFAEYNTNKNISDFADFVTNPESISNNSYKNIFLLHDFLNKFTNTENCNIGGVTLENIILLDQAGNVAIYKITNDAQTPENIVYIFKLNNNIHIEFVGTKKYTDVLEENMITNFDKEYEDNFDKSREEFSLNTLYALNTTNVFFNIFNKYNVIKQDLKIYLKDFCRILPEEGEITEISPLSKANIIHVTSFMNKMIEFIRMINLNYVQLNNNELYPDTEIDISGITEKEFDKKLNKLEINLVRESKKNFNELIIIFQNIIEKIIKDNKIYTQIKIILKYIYIHKKESIQSDLVQMLYTLILLIDSKFINIENRNDYDYIVNTYIYIENVEKVEMINKDIEDAKKKEGAIVSKYIATSLNKTIKKEKNFHFFTFFKVIMEFFQKSNELRKKFIENNLVLCNEVIKSIVLKTYVHYLNLQNNDILFPVSVKTHINRFNELLPASVINPDYIDLSKIKENFIISPDGRINNYKGHSFASCGESTLLNLLRYMLFDKEQNKITKENIEKLERLFPDNLLTKEIVIDGIPTKKIFDIEELKNKNNREQTEILKGKLNDFGAKLYAYKKPKIYNRGGICEIKPSFRNSMESLYYLLTQQEPLTKSIKLNVFIIQLIQQFNKSCELKFKTDLNCDEYITIHFTEDHGWITRNTVDDGEIDYYKNTKNLLIYLFNTSLDIHYEYNKVYILDNSNFDLYLEYHNKKQNRLICDGIYNEEILEDSKINFYEDITFGENFNQRISENTLLKCKSITFDRNFNQELGVNILPECEKITFGDNFNNGGYKTMNKPFISVLPKCKEIYFSSGFIQKIGENILQDCENITFGYHFNQKLYINSFPNCKVIKFGIYFNNDNNIFDCILPNCELITFGPVFNQELGLNVLPNCKEINFDEDFNNGGKPFNNLLQNCEYIWFGNKFNQELGLDILPKCKNIKFGDYYNNDRKPFNCVLPECEDIHFNEWFNQDLGINVLPKCKKIIFDGFYNNGGKPFNCVLPECEHISFSHPFNQELGVNILPNCKEINFGRDFNNGEKPFNCVLPECKLIHFVNNFKVELEPRILQNIENIILISYIEYYILKDKEINQLVLHNEELPEFDNIKRWLEINKGRFITEIEPETAATAAAAAAAAPVILPLAGGYYLKYMKYKNKYLQLKQNNLI